MNHNVALITGGSRGFGRAVAEALLKKHVKVCLVDINEETGQTTLNELTLKYGKENVEYVHCDVSNDGELRTAWEKCTSSLGAPDLLINNAGIAGEDNWQRTLQINVGGVIIGTLLAMEKMSKQNGGRGGRVVNVSSIAGIISFAVGPVYSATKHAVIGLTKSFGQQFHYSSTGVKVQCICPSFMQTSFFNDAPKTYFSVATSETMKKIQFLKTSVVTDAMMTLIEEGPNGGAITVEPNVDPYYHELSSSRSGVEALNGKTE